MACVRLMPQAYQQPVRFTSFYLCWFSFYVIWCHRILFIVVMDTNSRFCRRSSTYIYFVMPSTEATIYLWLFHFYDLSIFSIFQQMIENLLVTSLYIFFLFDNNVFDTHINKHWTIEDAPLHFHALIVVVAATANQVAHTNYNNTRAHMDWSFLVNVAVVVCWNWTCVLFRFLSHDFCRQWGSGQRNKWCVRSEKLETNGHLLIVNNWQSFQTWNTIYI